ncbi:MAG: alpha/beta hydrolase [candidate division Zixibacteria bacterium]|nr:alpha/beta hydrolase [candidate division Zixibacteria bacterium]
MLTWNDIAALPAPAAGLRIPYGDGAFQFGDLRLPEGTGPYPVAVVIHGGCWLSRIDLEHAGHLSVALNRAGLATWTLEYRRIGNPGGGWPGTFEDVAAGTDHLRTLATRFPLDIKRVVLIGHSAGGHLALWTAARPNFLKTHPLFSRDPLRVQGVVALAGITDLRAYGTGSGNCNASVYPLMGGTPAEVPERYALANPVELALSGVPVWLVHGTEDVIVPVEQSRRFRDIARSKGGEASLLTIQNAGHFEPIAPFTPAWKEVESVVRGLVALP